MIVIEIKKDEFEIVGALCRTLARHYPNAEIRWDKPQMSNNTVITIDGDDEQRFLEDCQCFFSKAGWKIEVR